MRARWIPLLVLVLASGCGGDGGVQTPTAPDQTSTVIDDLRFAPSALTGTRTVEGRISIRNAAPAGGLTVTLSSSEAAVTVPPSVTIPAARIRSRSTRLLLRCRMTDRL